MRPGRGLRSIVLTLVATAFIAPILGGFWHTARAAFGVLPGISATDLSLEPWHQLFAAPGIGRSLALTLWTGIAATVLSLMIALGTVAALQGHLSARVWTRLLAPLLAAPHAALAIGVAFLIAPSGWIARLISPWATGWIRPPDIATVGDPMGLALILGLIVKETPFLIFVCLSALPRLPVSADLAAGRALGYPPVLVWRRILLPRLYRLIRLPVFVVLSYSLSVVDMAMILGPAAPPTLAVRMLRWLHAPDLRMILPASAAALMLAGLTAAAILVWCIGERALRAIALGRLRAGRRGSPGWFPPLAAPAFGLTVLTGFLALAILLLWALADRWDFPDDMPRQWTLMNLAAPLSGWGGAAVATTIIGGASTALSMVLAIAWLEGEHRGGYARARWAEALIYLPLILPQVAFLNGLYMLQLRAGIAATPFAVIWVHAIFVFPYVMIVLSEAWRAFDGRLLQSAAALGAGPWRRLWSVRLPVLLAPLLAAAAVGFAVSVAQFLPTLFAGAGRVRTLTTEAVALSSGSDRRVTAVYGLLQAALPILTYAVALSLPRLMHRNRRGLTGGGAP